MESLRNRGRVVTGVFVAIPVVSALAALSDLSLLQYLQAISSREPADPSGADAIEALQTVTGTAQVALFVVCAITFLMWFYHAHKNLRAGGLNDLQYTPGWAVGGFFVPFLNFVRPFQVMQEVWMGSAYLSGEFQAESWQAVPPAPRVGWWWALFLISSFLGNASAHWMLHAEGLAQLRTAGWVTLASDLVDIPAALVALFLVRRVTEFQEQARARLRTAEADLGTSQGYTADGATRRR